MTRRTEPFADAQAALPFVIEQGRNVETAIYTRRYPTLNYGSTVPVVTEGAEWAIGTQFMTLDTTGVAKFLSGSGNDMPFNNTTRGLATHDFAMIGSGWEWNLEEINQAALYGVPLSDTKAQGASQSTEQLLYDIAMTGSTEKNWQGFVNSSLVSRADADNSGTGSSTFWSAKNVDQVMADINSALGGIRTNTNEIEWADSIRLPPSAFRDVATRRLSTGGDGLMTVLNYIRANNVYTAETGQPLDIQPLRDLETASQDGGGRMVVYRRTPEVVRFHLPMPRRVLPIHQKSIMSFETGVIARTGGTEWRLPAAAAYIDEITAPPA
jgi:hypothetical protein